MAGVWDAVLYPQVTAPVGDTTLWTEPIVPDQTPGWFQPTNQPVLAVAYRHLLPSLFFQGDPADFVEPDTSATESAWFQPANQPVLRLEYRYLLPSYFAHPNPDDFIEPGAEESGWFQPTYQPLRVVTPYLYYLPSFFTWLDPTGILEGFIVEVRPRTLTVFMQERTLTLELREGGRETT